MNVITICSSNDLLKLQYKDICLSGIAEDEITQNMWCIAIDEHGINQITTNMLMHFFDNLISQNEQHIRSSYPEIQATLYVWFDKQALQLRFNILSGVAIELPFRCSLNIVSSLRTIIDNFLNAVHTATQLGDNLAVSNNDDYEFNNDDEQVFILDVYVRILNQKVRQDSPV